AAALEDVLSHFTLTSTVEAEYGETLVKGTDMTLAHHGPRQHHICPCMVENRSNDAAPVEAIGVSHMDLDTVGGIMACLGIKPSGYGVFWGIAAQVDVKGPHKLGEITAPGMKCGDSRTTEAIQALNAYWAFSEGHRVFAPRGGSTKDVTSEVWEHIEALLKILILADKDLLQVGRDWADAKEELNKSSFISYENGVVVREASCFTNHLYNTPSGDVAKAVVSLRLDTKAVTLSLESPINGVDCSVIAQSLWGSEAGGHASIAGSPRHIEYTIQDALDAAQALAKAINAE
ncbi:MAG: hypothetical protein ACQKBW_07585, partial [Puniceicoccales bacterium]